MFRRRLQRTLDAAPVEAVVSLLVYIRLMHNQVLHYVGMTFGRSANQGRPSVFITFGIHIGSLREQSFDFGQFTLTGGSEQRFVEKHVT